MSEIENDLSDATAAPNRYGAALTTAAMVAVGLVPGVGGAVQTIAQGTLAQRQAEREADMALRVARRLQALEAQPSPEEVLASDEFVAAWTRAQRVAAETANVEKRERIARVLAHTGPWGPWDPEDRQFLLDLVLRYDEEQILLLGFFRDPVAWVGRSHPGFRPPIGGMSGISVIVERHLFPDNPAARLRLKRTIDGFARDGVAEVPLTSTMSSDGTYAKRTTDFGDRFLDYIAS